MKVLHLVSRDDEKLKQRLRRRAREENREDDAREAILEHRFAVYREQTAGILDLYPDDRVADIDALAPPLRVLGQIVNTLLADPSLGKWTERQG